jgi:hypothetical protein
LASGKQADIGFARLLEHEAAQRHGAASSRLLKLMRFSDSGR